MADPPESPVHEPPSGVLETPDPEHARANDGAQPLAPACSVEMTVDLPPLVICWRCGRSTPESANCQHCGARARGKPRAAEQAGKSTETGVAGDGTRSVATETTALQRMFVISGLLVLTSLVLGWLTMLAGGADTGPDFLGRCGAMEAIDTLLVLWGLYWIRPRATTPGVTARPLLAWCIAWPLLAAMLLLNRTYHSALVEFVNSPHLANPFPEADRFLGWYVVVVCLQPAIVEELFFRQTVLRTLGGIVSPQGAIWIGATMFGLAHLGQLVSLPYLILLGGVLGYMRLLSGGLLLPMLLHFIHNGYVLWTSLTN